MKQIKGYLNETLQPMAAKAKKCLENNEEEAAFKEYKTLALAGIQGGNHHLIKSEGGVDLAGVVAPQRTVKRIFLDEAIINARAFYYRAMVFFEMKQLQKALDDIDFAITVAKTAEFKKVVQTEKSHGRIDKVITAAKDLTRVGGSKDYLLFLYYVRAKLCYEMQQVDKAAETINMALQHVEKVTVKKIAWNTELDSIPYTILNIDIKLDNVIERPSKYSGDQHFVFYEIFKFKNAVVAKLIYMQGKLLREQQKYNEAINTFQKITEMLDVSQKDKNNAATAIQTIMDANNKVIVDIFTEVMQKPDLLNKNLLEEMFGKVVSLFDFKFPYTLANILRKEETANKKEIDIIIYQALEELARNHIVDSKCVAAFKLLLDSAHSKGIINTGQKYLLDNEAEDKKTFSDPRFKLMQRHINILEKNIKVVGNELQLLKEALQQKAVKNVIRQMLIGAVKVGLAFVGGEVIGNILQNVWDFSNLAELGAVVLNKPEKEIEALFKLGKQLVVANKKAIMSAAADQTITRIGFNPDEFFDAWVETNFALQNLDSSPADIFSNTSGFFPAKSSFEISNELKEYLQARYQEGYKFIAKKDGDTKIVIECTAAKIGDSMIETHLTKLLKFFQSELEKASIKNNVTFKNRLNYSVMLSTQKPIIDKIEQILEAMSGQQSTQILHSQFMDEGVIECKAM